MNAVLHGASLPDANDPAVAGDLAARFPPGFLWGAATSAFQIEGAASVDGRGPSIWDTFCAVPGNVLGGGTGEVACDHYHRLEQDLDLMQALGLPAYRFSIAWPRVQPAGAGAWNGAGLAFYDRLVDGLLARGIQPHATLYHWDLPQALQDAGGWASRETVGRFVDYADGIGRHLGDRLASIATHNEPWVVATLGHEQGIFAPGLRDRRAAFLAAHHLLLSHGLALQSLRATGLRCPLGIVLNQSPTEALQATPAAEARAWLEDGLLVRWYMDPLFRGSYPADVVAYLGADAPAVHPGDLENIRQPLDFLGLNYYTRNLADERGVQPPAPGTPGLTAMGWEVHPAGLTRLLQRLHRDYQLPALYIMENGAAFDDAKVRGEVADPQRIDYLRRHLEAVADARETGVDVRGYFVWSLLDNFEWASGYARRFGIVHVDYESLERTPKHSARWYAALLAAHAAQALRESGR